MNRRNAIKILGISSAAVVTSTYWLNKKRDNSALSINLILEQLTNIDPNSMFTESEWNITRTLEHLAQSIEFSMLGYPEMKSKMFQNTVGQLAFSVFQANGKMTHNLNEVIPGEVISKNSLTPTQALQRLIKALETFDSFDGQLKPHFAYGKLSKSEYAIAHVLHINNHFEKINFA